MADHLRSPAWMSRQQRRRMEQIADKVDRIIEGDRLFFERHPDRSHRIRLMAAAERDQIGMLHDLETLVTPLGEEWITAVCQLAPGVRLRRFLSVVAGADLDLSEAACRGVFKAVAEHDDQAAEFAEAIRAAGGGGHA